MEGAKENLTHEEIWDDSALVNSWNEALEEYKARQTDFHGRSSGTEMSGRMLT